MQSNGLFALILMANSFINTLMPFVISLTVFFFLWGLFNMVRASDGDAREEARGYVTWGVIALFVMVTVWGLVNILVRSFNLDNSVPYYPVVRNVQ